MTIELSPRLPDDERPRDYANLAAEQVDLENVINELLLRLTGWPNDHPDRAEARWPAIEGTLGVNQDALIRTVRSPAAWVCSANGGPS